MNNKIFSPTDMCSVGVFGKNCFFNIYVVKYHKEITNVLYLI